MFKLRLEGNKALLKKLEKISRETAENVGYEIEASVNKIESEAKQRVPVDTGFLKNSIIAEATGLEGQVEARSHYAPYIEFGTGGSVSIPSGLEDYAMKFKGKGVVKVSIPPQPFLYPAFITEVPKLMDRINKGLKKETK